MRQGINKKSYPNGATYTGHYLDDRRHGFGLKVHADGVTIKSCYYENGRAIAYTYTRDDGFIVACHGGINETPMLRITLSDSPDIHIQMNVTYLDKGQTLNTWRSWTKFLNKHSRFAGKIMRIESTTNDC